MKNVNQFLCQYQCERNFGFSLLAAVLGNSSDPRPYGRSLAMVLASGGRVRLDSAHVTPWKPLPKFHEFRNSPRNQLAPRFRKKREIFPNLENFHPFWAGRAGKILASFFVSESPFESFSKFVKTKPGPQSWCLYTETHRNKSQQHFSRIFTSTNLSPI